MPRTCPHPEKLSFHGLVRAADEAVELMERHGSPLRPYRCDCGAYHLTTKGFEGATITEAQVYELQYQARLAMV
jgi:hypothetical protein